MPKRISDTQRRILDTLRRFDTTIVEAPTRHGPTVRFKARVGKPDRKIRARTVHSLAAQGWLRRNEAGEWELTDGGERE